MVLINANDEAQTFTAAEMEGLKLALHPVQRASADPVVLNASFNSSTGAFTIPARVPWRCSWPTIQPRQDAAPDRGRPGAGER